MFFHIPTPPAHQLTPFSPDVELRQLLFMVEQGISHKASAIETGWRQEMNPLGLMMKSWWSRSHGSVESLTKDLVKHLFSKLLTILMMK